MSLEATILLCGLCYFLGHGVARETRPGRGSPFGANLIVFVVWVGSVIAMIVNALR